VSLRSRESARVDLERTSACYIVFPYVSNQTPATLKVSQPTSRPDSKCLLCRFDDVPIGPYVNTIDKELPKASNQMEEALQWNFIKQFVRNIGWPLSIAGNILWISDTEPQAYVACLDSIGTRNCDSGAGVLNHPLLK
jgi:hypothetical protein